MIAGLTMGLFVACVGVFLLLGLLVACFGVFLLLGLLVACVGVFLLLRFAASGKVCSEAVHDADALA